MDVEGINGTFEQVCNNGTLAYQGTKSTLSWPFMLDCERPDKLDFRLPVLDKDLQDLQKAKEADKRSRRKKTDDNDDIEDDDYDSGCDEDYYDDGDDDNSNNNRDHLYYAESDVDEQENIDSSYDPSDDLDSVAGANAN